MKRLTGFIGEGYYPKSRDWYRLFRRDHMRQATTPLKAATEYVHPDELLTWTLS